MGTSLCRHCLRLLLLLNTFLLINSLFNPQHFGKPNLHQRQAKPTSTLRFPALRNTFFKKKGFEVFNPSSKDGKQGCGTVDNSFKITEEGGERIENDKLGTTNHPMIRSKCKVRVGFASLNTTLGGEFGEVGYRQHRISILVFTSSRR